MRNELDELNIYKYHTQHTLAASSAFLLTGVYYDTLVSAQLNIFELPWVVYCGDSQRHRSKTARSCTGEVDVGTYFTPHEANKC